MSDYIFPLLVTGVILLVLAYIGSFIYGAVRHQMMYASIVTTQMYSDIAKSVIVSSGIVTSILASALDSHAVPHYLTSRTMIYLAIAIVSSVLLTMVLTRSAEVALSRAMREGQPVTDSSSARLSWFELSLALICGGVSLATFMIGILYLGRIGYELGK